MQLSLTHYRVPLVAGLAAILVGLFFSYLARECDDLTRGMLSGVGLGMSGLLGVILIGVGVLLILRGHSPSSDDAGSVVGSSLLTFGVLLPFAFGVGVKLFTAVAC